MKKQKKFVIDEGKCKGCQLCVTFCPKKALAIGNKINKLGYRYITVDKPDDCNACGICAEVCPDIVIEVWRE